ncbi:MAG: hypothetical protein JWO51_5024 [Rhodospirillales bacterium]|nr:hypothetical protein [Rhodospirillales bacterium]
MFRIPTEQIPGRSKPKENGFDHRGAPGDSIGTLPARIIWQLTGSARWNFLGIKNCSRINRPLGIKVTMKPNSATIAK